MSLDLLIKNLKQERSAPKYFSNNGQLSAFRYICEFAEDGETNVEKYLPGISIPIELSKFWDLTKSATLFKDADYGQWGLRILKSESVAIHTQEYFDQRKDETLIGDLVVGEFLGDSELLIIRCDKSKTDYGSVLIATPIDKREDWYVLSLDFSEYLHQYVDAGGEKYWEST